MILLVWKVEAALAATTQASVESVVVLGFVVRDALYLILKFTDLVVQFLYLIGEFAD